MSTDYSDSVPSFDRAGSNVKPTDDTNVLIANTRSLSIKDSNLQMEESNHVAMHGKVSTDDEEEGKDRRKKSLDSSHSHASLYRQDSDKQLPGLALAYRSLIRGVGEDPARQGLRKTPERAAKALMFFTKGYEEKIEGMYLFDSCLFLSLKLLGEKTYPEHKTNFVFKTVWKCIVFTERFLFNCSKRASLCINSAKNLLVNN